MEDEIVRIGKVELRGEPAIVFLSELVEDIPVDPAHVQNIARLIRANGFLGHILVRKENKRVIDGAHRAQAMREVGEFQIPALLIECTEEQFWDLRIASARVHKTVSFARIVAWARIAFSSTEWAEKMGVEDAFQMGRRGAAAHVFLSPHERGELTEWVQKKAELWALDSKRISRMLRIAQMVEPQLTSQVRDEQRPGVLTRNMLDVIGRKVRRVDLQQQLVHKIHAEKLTLKDVENVASQLAQTTTELQRRKVVYEPYRRRSLRGRPTTHATLELQRIRAGVVGDAIREVIEYLPVLQSPQPFETSVTDAIAVLARYLGQEDVTALEILQRENRELKEENTKLLTKTEQQGQTITSQQRQITELNRILSMPT